MAHLAKPFYNATVCLLQFLWHFEEMIPKLGEHVVPLGRWSISGTLAHLNQYTMHTFVLL
jgi:hypothetical protein